MCRERSSDPLLDERGAGAYYAAGTVVIGYPRPGSPGWEEAVWRAAVAHEVGHAWWFAHPSADTMRAYQAIRGEAMIQPFIEDYADVFSAIVGGTAPPHLRYIGTPPPAEQVEAICAARLMPC